MLWEGLNFIPEIDFYIQIFRSEHAHGMLRQVPNTSRSASKFLCLSFLDMKCWLIVLLHRLLIIGLCKSSANHVWMVTILWQWIYISCFWLPSLLWYVGTYFRAKDEETTTAALGYRLSGMRRCLKNFSTQHPFPWFCILYLKSTPRWKEVFPEIGARD